MDAKTGGAMHVSGLYQNCKFLAHLICKQFEVRVTGYEVNILKEKHYDASPIASTMVQQELEVL